MSKPITCYGGVLHPGQLRIKDEIVNSNCMYHTVCTPRQFGKSFLCIQLLLYYALNNSKSKLMFCSPVYAQTTRIYNELLEGIKQSPIIKKKNSSENSIIFINGSELYFKSVTMADNLRGFSINYLFLDEFAQYKPQVFDAVLRPMLTTVGKKCLLFSTPKGKNDFYNMYQLGKNENNRYCSHFGSSVENPFANKEEIEAARLALPENLFKQEYEGLFVEDGGEVFSNIKLCSLSKEWPIKQSNVTYYAGIDSGRQDDWSVLTIIGSDNKIYNITRLRHMEWRTIINKFVEVLKFFQPRQTLIECNGIGDVVFSMTKEQFPKVDPFITTNDSKQQIIEDLILEFSDKKIVIPTNELFEPLTEELINFSFVYSQKSRKICYGARIGSHDDTVMSLAMANHAKKFGATKGIYKLSIV